ncbi:MAG: hypothetical protein M3N14_11115 [Bacteroidota bacterium]|nr:hypothetical protein [Bacteroidota bacterium]
MSTASKICIVILLVISPMFLCAQIRTFDQAKKAAVDSLTSPNLLNEAMARYMLALQNKNPDAYKLIRNVNLKFKTFQAGAQPPGLGFSYQYDNSWTKNNIGNSGDANQSFNLNLDGNVAFKKIYNPVNFLESRFFYNSTFFWGGFAKKNTPEQGKQLRQVFRDYNEALKNRDEARQASLMAEANKLTVITDQYYIGINGSASYESNQDFSKTQFIPSLLFNAGASSISNSGALHWFNIPDYPFALIRLLTGTDRHFSVSGVAIPALLFGLDHVIPTQDSLRRAVTGSLSPFTRVRFEISFKTEAARAGNQVIWFSADYRWYQQLAASQALINAKIDHFNYFTCNLSSTNGFFVSYSYGQLPFDKRKDSVYALGFKYDLGNWTK